MFRVSLRTLFLVTTIVAALASRVGVERGDPDAYPPYRYTPMTVYHRHPVCDGVTQYTVLYHLSRK